KWDEKGSVIENYKSFSVASNPNFLGVRACTDHIVENNSLQMPPSGDDAVSEFEQIDNGNELEEDDLKSALGKKRTDGKHTPLQPLTAIQRVNVSRLVEKFGDDHKSMFMDIKLNKMQHSVETLEKLCKRYQMYKDKNPLIVGPWKKK
ncbi:hypothetical protein PHJA_000864500, partial [Phtheirospermum japonicum]